VKYEVYLTDKDNDGDPLGGVFKFTFKQIEFPHKDKEFLAELEKQASMEIFPGEIHAIIAIPEPGEPGYRDPNNLDMFSEVGL